MNLSFHLQLALNENGIITVCKQVCSGFDAIFILLDRYSSFFLLYIEKNSLKIVPNCI